MATTGKALRELIVAAARRIADASFGGALGGDISVRVDESILITPSGVSFSDLRPPMLAVMPVGGEYGAWKGPIKPTADWRIHLDIARARPDVGAVVRFPEPLRNGALDGAQIHPRRSRDDRTVWRA
jgi:L-fuculose-phosphate aldolase